MSVLASGLAGAASTVVYYHNDLAGSPIAATNESGQVIWRESYRPYGERLTNDTASAGNKIWFTSRSQDADTGLVYMGARWYDPTVGRFVAIDPRYFDEKNLHSFNRYAYANNNPLGYVDLDGRVPLPLILIPIIKAAVAWGAAGFAAHSGIDAASQAAAFGVVDWKGAAQEGLNAAPAYALGGAAGEALAGGIAVSRVVKGSGTDFFEGAKYTEKVLAQMKQGDLHAFPESVKGFQQSGEITRVSGGDGVAREMLKIPGEYRGKTGSFEFVKDADGTINHRFFRPNSEK